MQITIPFMKLIMYLGSKINEKVALHKADFSAQLTVRIHGGAIVKFTHLYRKTVE